MRKRLPRSLRKAKAVVHVPRPTGSISLATLTDMRRRDPTTDFCRCGDPAFGEHLSSKIESDDRTILIHFYPDAERQTVIVLHIGDAE